MILFPSVRTARKAAAMKLADDFGISYDNGEASNQAPYPGLPRNRDTARKKADATKVLSITSIISRTWKQYAPAARRMNGIRCSWKHCKESHIEYLLDVLLYTHSREKKALVAEQRKR